jgi:hypothetical protein
MSLTDLQNHETMAHKIAEEKPKKSEESSAGALSLSTSNKIDETTFPEGGRRAWFVASGAAGVLFCTFGYANAFGSVRGMHFTHNINIPNMKKIFSLFIASFRNTMEHTNSPTRHLLRFPG